MAKLQHLGLAAAITAVLSAPAYAFDLGADMEYNFDVVDAATSDIDQNGRLKLSASHKHEVGAGYVQAQGQLLVPVSGDAGIDDAWIRFGQESWSLTFGRFEATDSFSAGKDTVMNTIGNTKQYKAKALRGRVTDGEMAHMALNTNFGAFGFELGLAAGETDGDASIVGVRPVFTIDATDDLRLTLTAESVMGDNDAETTGGALYVRYATDAFALKVNYAAGTIDSGTTTAAGTPREIDTTSANINLEVGSFGIGFQASDDDGGATESVVYTAYTFSNLMGVSNASTTIAASVASGEDAQGASVDDKTALRLRFNYTL